MPMRVLDNSMVNLELFPGKPGEQVEGGAQKQAEGAASTAQQTADGAQKQASGAAQSWSEKAQGLQQQAGEYQSQTADTIKGYGDAAHQQGQDYVQSAAASSGEAAKSRLPESTHSYADSAVNYAGNFASGTVGTLAGGVKDAGDTVGNAGYETAAGLGKTGYNLASGLGGAVMGKSSKETTTEAKATEDVKPDEEEESQPA